MREIAKEQGPEFRIEGDAVIFDGVKIALVRGDGGLKMARGCGRHRSAVVEFLAGAVRGGGDLPGLRRSGPERDVAAVYDRRASAACAAPGAELCGDEGGKLIGGCGGLPPASDGHRPPPHPSGPLVPGAVGEEPLRTSAPARPHLEPPCPAEDPRAGDKTPEVVAWFFRYRPEEAEAKYRGRRFEMAAR